MTLLVGDNVQFGSIDRLMIMKKAQNIKNRKNVMKKTKNLRRGGRPFHYMRQVLTQTGSLWLTHAALGSPAERAALGGGE